MNTIKGMIKDLRREETHIGGCTTKGELIIALESLERSVELPYNATNGDVITTIFPKYTFIDSILPFDGVDMNIIECAERDLFFDIDWWNAPYREE